MTTTTTTPDSTDFEWWQRALDRVQHWRAAHPVASRRISLARAVTTWAALLVTIVALVVVPEVREAALKSLLFLVPVIVLFLLARTRTVGWRLVSAVFTVSVLGSLLIALTSHALGNAMEGSNSNGPAIAIASHFEEIGKLLPLGLLAIFAPGRVRRFAATDWFVLGYAAGAAFMATEEGARAIEYALNPGLSSVHEAIQGATTAPTVFLNPFSVAVLGDSGSAFAAGHPVSTSMVAGSIGIGIAAWRAWPGRRRWLALLFPALALALAISDHALFNAGWDDLSILFNAEGLPVPMTLLWLITGRGYALPWICAAVFVACLLLDVARRQRADPQGRHPFFLLPAASTRALAVQRWAQSRGWLASAYSLVALAGLQWWSDARIAISGFARSAGEPARIAAQRGRRTRAASLVARQRAMAATTPADTLPQRARFGRVSLAIVIVGVLYALVVGVGLAGWIGGALPYPGDQHWPWENLGGILDYLENWWNNLPIWQKLLIEIGLIGLLWAYGLPLSLAATRTGYLAYFVGHSMEGQRLLDDPAGSVGHYLLYRSPAQMVADGLDLGLTFTPARLGIHGPIAETTAFFLGDSVIEHVADAPIANVSIAAQFSADQQLAKLGLPAGSATVLPPSPAAHPAMSGNGVIADASPSEVVASRSGLQPNTRYDVPGRGSYFTAGDGRVVLVEQVKGGDISIDIANAKPGVEYVRDGWVYGVDHNGELWMRQAS